MLKKTRRNLCSYSGPGFYLGFKKCPPINGPIQLLWTRSFQIWPCPFIGTVVCHVTVVCSVGSYICYPSVKIVHMVLFTNTPAACSQLTKGPASHNTCTLGQFRQEIWTWRSTQFLAPKLARFLASSQAFEKFSFCVAEVISSVCMSVLLVKYQELRLCMGVLGSGENGVKKCNLTLT